MWTPLKYETMIFLLSRQISWKKAFHVWRRCGVSPWDGWLRRWHWRWWTRRWRLWSGKLKLTLWRRTEIWSCFVTLRLQLKLELQIWSCSEIKNVLLPSCFKRFFFSPLSARPEYKPTKNPLQDWISSWLITGIYGVSLTLGVASNDMNALEDTVHRKEARRLCNPW